ncbi:hypothetical protein EWM64_g5276 [Hericium alpestre]|uniref:Uncharacterized protein n=1 Tax=Hericium alpestre TaxID=135208 RepID=A0A4Y9ZXI6_9AGAM|nr:hypothetical protein EWM64_g5276 [Hericium alpestre]
MPRDSQLGKKQQAAAKKRAAPASKNRGSATSRSQAGRQDPASAQDTTGNARQRRAEPDGRAGLSRRPVQKRPPIRSAAARDLENELESLKKQLESAKRQLQDKNQNREEEQMIPRPKGIGKGRGGIADAMGLDGDEEDRYLYVRMLHDMRTVVENANVDWSLPYRKQDPEKMGRIYKRMRTLFPILSRYQNNWATGLMVQQYMNNHRKYAAACGYTTAAGKGSRCGTSDELQSIDDIIDDEAAEGPGGGGESDEETEDGGAGSGNGNGGEGELEGDDD